MKVHNTSTWDNDQNPFNVLGSLSTDVSPVTFDISMHWSVDLPDEHVHKALCDSYEFVQTTVDSSLLKYKGRQMKSCAVYAIRDLYREGHCSAAKTFQLLRAVSSCPTDPIKSLYELNVVKQLHVPVLQFLVNKKLLRVKYMNGKPLNMSLTPEGSSLLGL